MTNLMIIAILAVVLGAAAGYIYKSRKAGHKCIGCPGGCSAESGCGGCCGCSEE